MASPGSNSTTSPNTSGSSENSAFLDRNVPQWKKELIQRRKNLAKTINATNLAMSPPPPMINNGAGKPVIGSPSKPNKDLATLRSPTHAGTAETGITPSITSPTTSHRTSISSNHSNTTSPSSNIVGHSHHNSNTTSLISTTKSSESTLLKPHTNKLTLKSNNCSSHEVETPLHSQSHSNDGGVNNNYSGSSNDSNHKLVGLIRPSTIKTDKSVVGPLLSSISGGDLNNLVNQSSANGKQIKCGAFDKEKPENLVQNSLLTKSSSASSVQCEQPSPPTTKTIKKHIEFTLNNQKMVAADDEVPMADDGSEELTYGPGIVSKLRCRYLSLALRQSKASRQRPSLNNMRRATSLNNLLDGDHGDEEEEEDDSDRSEEYDDTSEGTHKEKAWKKDHEDIDCRQRNDCQKNGNFLNVDDVDEGHHEGDYVGAYQKNRNRSNDKNDYNRYKRGNEQLMKRARSVETLLRYENKTTSWNNKDTGHVVADTKDKIAVHEDEHIESRIVNAREHGVPKPKRLTSHIDDDERPPPDVVKQTLKIFEATNNRRGRTTNRKIGSEVAAKVATFKSIISLEKPLIAHAKPPLSPKKPNVKPRTNIIGNDSLPKVYSPNNSTVITPTAGNFDKMKQFNKEKPVLPKLDINIIKNNLESANHNNSNNSNSKSNYQENNVKKQQQQQQRTPSPVTVRCDFQSYRNISRNESPLSPPMRSGSSSPSVLYTPPTYHSRGPPPPPPTQQQQIATPTQRSDSPRKFYANLMTNNNFESPFNHLSEKLNNFNLNDTSTPKMTKASPIGPPPLPPPRTISVATAATNNSLMNKLSPTLNSIIGNDQKVNKPPKKDNTNLNVQPQRPTDSSSSDFDDDYDDADEVQNKRISRTALDNIAKAGLTTEFKFGASKNSMCDSKNAKNQMLNEKSYLPNGANRSAVSVKKELNTEQSTNNLKQVGVVKPSLYETPAAPLTQANVTGHNHQSKTESNNYSFLDPTENENAADRYSSASSASSASSNSSFIDIGDVAVLKQSAKSTISSVSNSDAKQQKQLPVASDSVVIGHLNNNSNHNGSLLGPAAQPAIPATAGNTTTTTAASFLLLNNTNNKDSNTVCSNNFIEKPVLTSREIEKNLLNKEKSFVESLPSSNQGGGGGGSSGSGSTSGSVDNGVAATNNVVVASIATASPNTSASVVNNKKKSWQQPQQENNTMVFNFSNRSDVPDYIENAGIMIRRKKELPKPGESGFVLLGDLTLETSTDEPEEDAWTLGPPSPCTVEFPDGGVIINGKSSLRSKPKEAKLKIQFDDSLTSTFEYPSESSLLEDVADDMTDRTLYGDGIMSNTKLLTSMPLGTNPFASYTPVKASIASHFELGVTRVPSPPTNGQTNNNTSISSSSSSINNYHINGTNNTTASNTSSPFVVAMNNSLSSPTSVALMANATPLLAMEETDSIQYLKPATDEQTVAWSEGTRATDLLF